MGAVIALKGFSPVNWGVFFGKIVIPSLLAPFIGMLAGVLMMTLTYLRFGNFSPSKVNNVFKRLQLLSASLMAFSHGSNDAQKSMGIITMALVSMGLLNTFSVPLWVKLACATMMALGTAAGGWRIIRTMGMKMVKLRPVQGFAAETSAAFTILGASHLGMPISTTYVITSSIMGVGISKRLSNVRWNVIGQILLAWLFTIPISALISAVIYLLLKLI